MNRRISREEFDQLNHYYNYEVPAYPINDSDDLNYKQRDVILITNVGNCLNCIEDTGSTGLGLMVIW